MRAVALFCIALCSQEPAPQTKLYADENLGLAFSYPASWTVSKGKRESRISMRLAGASETASIEFFSVAFQSEISVWEAAQRQINEQLGHQIIRQWQEEILGVPFLLTKVQMKPGAEGSKTLLTGLMYAALDTKLLFRLSAPSSLYDQAEFEWRKVLETLRTADGQIPKPEDPNRPRTDPKTTKPENTKPVKPPPFTVVSGASKAKIVRAEVSVPIQQAGRNLILYVPKGWTATLTDAGSATLSNAGLGKDVILKFHSTLDSDSPGKALAKAAAESLKEYEKVDRREESLPKSNDGGAMVAWLWRVGAGKQGPLSTCLSVGLTGQFYWQLEWRLASAPTQAQRSLLFALIGAMSLELSP